MTTIRLVDLDFYAYHGVPDEEQSVGHRYRLDLRLEVDETARFSDDVAETIDYADVAGWCLKKGTETRYRTLERLAELLGLGLLDRYPRLHRVQLVLAKQLPPMPFLLESVSIERDFRRKPLPLAKEAS